MQKIKKQFIFFFKMIKLLLLGSNNLFTLELGNQKVIFQRSRDLQSDIQKIKDRKNFDVIVEPTEVPNIPHIKKLHNCFVVTFKKHVQELIPVLFIYNNEKGWVQKDCFDMGYFFSKKAAFGENFTNKFYLIEKI